MLQKTGSDNGTETDENLETQLTAGPQSDWQGRLGNQRGWPGVHQETWPGAGFRKGFEPGDKEEETWAGTSPWTLLAEGSSLLTTHDPG